MTLRHWAALLGFATLTASLRMPPRGVTGSSAPAIAPIAAANTFVGMRLPDGAPRPLPVPDGNVAERRPNPTCPRRPRQPRLRRRPPPRPLPAIPTAARPAARPTTAPIRQRA